MERRSSKEYSVVFLVEGKKVQVTKFAFDDSIFVVGSAPTRSAQWLSSPHLAAVLRTKLAELVPSGFFLFTTMVFAAVRAHFSKENTCV